VRELRNLMERLVIMIPDAEVRASDLHLESVQLTGRRDDLQWAGSLKDARETFEREFVRRALMRHGGNISKTAEELDIERRHLYRRMASLGLQKESDHGHD
jgi:DNA-binding NtrC family response regulator